MNFQLWFQQYIRKSFLNRTAFLAIFWVYPFDNWVRAVPYCQLNLWQITGSGWDWETARIFNFGRPKVNPLSRSKLNFRNLGRRNLQNQLSDRWCQLFYSCYFTSNLWHSEIIQATILQKLFFFGGKISKKSIDNREIFDLLDRRKRLGLKQTICELNGKPEYC